MSNPNPEGPGSKPQQNDSPIPIMGLSRKAPPKVQPITYKGIRYEQVMDAHSMGYDQRTGYLAAYDEKDNRLLWMEKIYTINRIENIEQDVQDVFFQSMILDELSGKITIKNEIGGMYSIDINNRSVQMIK